MNKVARVMLSVLLTACFALLSAGPALAFPLPAKVTWGDPVVTPSHPVDQVMVKVLEQAQLPGTFELPDGQVVPVGFPQGEAQFGGKGVAVSQTVEGIDTLVCFPFPLYAHEWSGRVHQWTGSKWAALVTTITPGAETDPAWACTNVASSGTYALIIGYYGKPERHIR